MPHPARLIGALAILILARQAFPAADEPLHVKIDQLILAKAPGKPASPVADDGEFVRRVYLDLAGRIPSVEEARVFLDDKDADKRAKLVDKLLAGPDYPRRMQEQFHIMLMERLGESPDWAKYLRSSFEANKPWDQLVREILKGTADDATKGSTFFYAKRLENYGQNPVDYSGLTRDVGRLFLGMDLRCAECHDHLFIEDYTQQDFKGLHGFFQSAALQQGAVVEKPVTKKIDYISVFKKEPKETHLRIPGLGDVEIPEQLKGKEYVTPPDPKTKRPGVLKFSPLATLAEKLPVAENKAFAKNIVNRLWFVMMGRGLVHPLDLHHSDNPPSHPEVLDLLAREFVIKKFDIKWLIRELALTQTYQRSSVLPKDVKDLPPESFLTAIEKRLSAEQLLLAMLEATGEKRPEGTALTLLQTKFLKAFANPRREPEDEFNPSLKAALFVLNDDTVLGWLNPKPGNLVDRLGKIEAADQLAEELFLSVLTRRPSAEEKQLVAEHLAKHQENRTKAVGQLAWALLATTEFCVNH